MKCNSKVFNLTGQLPKKEDFGLTSQIKRSALSVSGNLAEGFGRKHTKDKLNFYYDSRGAPAKTKNHLSYGENVGISLRKNLKRATLSLRLYGKN